MSLACRIIFAQESCFSYRLHCFLLRWTSGKVMRYLYHENLSNSSLINANNVVCMLRQTFDHLLNFYLIFRLRLVRNVDFHSPYRDTITTFRREIHENHDLDGRIIKSNRFLQRLVHSALKLLKSQPIKCRFSRIATHSKNCIYEKATSFFILQKFDQLRLTPSME